MSPFLAIVLSILPVLVEGIAVAVAAFMIPARLGLQEALSIGVSAASAMLLLDRLAPTVGKYSRIGAGFGIGRNLVTV